MPDSPRKKLLKGAYKSAIAALSGTNVGMSILSSFHFANLDPTQWSAATWEGIKHNLILGGVLVLFAELRYAKQWFDAWANTEDN